MNKTLFLVFFFMTTGISFGQMSENLAGTYLLENGLDSVSLTIDKNGSFKIVSTSICHGDDVLGSKGTWRSDGDTVTLITDSRTKAGERTKTYEYKPQSSYLLKNDSLLFINTNKLLQPKFSYRRTSRYKDSLKNVLPIQNVKWLLLNCTWLLTSDQTDSTVLASKTLSFVCSNNFAFSDSIQLHPSLRLYEYDEYYGFKEAHFSFSFNSAFRYIDNKLSSIGCLSPQYGFWSLDSNRSEITLTFLDSKNADSDDFNTWPVKHKSSYQIIYLSAGKLVLQKN